MLGRQFYTAIHRCLFINENNKNKINITKRREIVYKHNKRVLITEKIRYLNPSLMVNVLSSGRGVFAAKTFEKNDFLLEYRGNLLTTDPGYGTYVYMFQYGGKYRW